MIPFTLMFGDDAMILGDANHDQLTYFNLSFFVVWGDMKFKNEFE